MAGASARCSSCVSLEHRTLGGGWGCAVSTFGSKPGSRFGVSSPSPVDSWKEQTCPPKSPLSRLSGVHSTDFSTGLGEPSVAQVARTFKMEFIPQIHCRSNT